MKKIKKIANYIFILEIIGVLFLAKFVYQKYQIANPQVEFEIVKLEQRDLKKTISIDGQVVADYEISLASEIPGIISKVYVKEGDKVKKGKLLMKLKDTDYRNQINSAYASQKITEVAYEKTKNPNQNLDLDKEIIKDGKEVVIVNINKIKDDIKVNIDSLEIYLSQLLRLEIDDYFDHTEFDDGYNTNPVFTYRIKSRVEIENLEKKRKKLGNEFKAYQNSEHTLNNSLEIISEFESIILDLYLNSQDFLGYSEIERERKEKVLSVLKAEVVNKKNTLKSLQTELSRLEKELETNDKSEEKLETVVNPADLKLAAEQIKQAQVITHNAYTQLQKTYLRAPKSGVIVKLHKEVGEYAAPATPLIKINSQNKYILADIPEVDLGKVKIKAPVQIKLDAFPNEMINGKIEFIYPTAKDVKGLVYYEVKISFADKNNNIVILPGMSAEIFIDYEQKDNVLSLDRMVAQKDGNKYFVEVINQEKIGKLDPKFIQKYFQVGFVGDNYLEVLDTSLKQWEIVKIDDRE